MARRRFLAQAAALAGLPLLNACQEVLHWGVPIHIERPGMAAGHQIRDALRSQTTQPLGERRARVVVIGSGVAGLFAAWRLRREGWNDVVVLNGPEPDGNASAGAFGEWAYPQGAHYLPLPSKESSHLRELLHEMGVLEANPQADRPRYDPAVLVHSPAERLYINGAWQEGLLPQAVSPEERAQQQRFLKFIEQLKTTRGADGKRVFTVPLAQASHDPQWRQLDQLSFTTWLDQQGYSAPSLRWYLDYCCRDDYGLSAAQTSAWAGLHYFAARRGQAANAEEGAVLTWPTGLNPLVQHMRQRIGAERFIDGAAWRVQDDARITGGEVWVDYLNTQGAQRLRAERVVMATPLFVSTHLLPNMTHYGFEAKQHLPRSAPWLVGNFLMQPFPPEPEAVPLAWDNVLYQSPSLGYVVSTHQLIRAARPSHTVFTTYHAYAGEAPQHVRQRLATQNAQSLFEQASQDLYTVYGWRLRKYLVEARLTVRGHAMASPLPGFLSNAGNLALRAANGKVLFAHADLSGMSLFEEAAWWGEQAARQILRHG